MKGGHGFETRVYLLDVTERCPNRRSMQELVDVLARFGYNEFRLYDTAKEREDALDTAKIEAYCRMQGIGFEVVGEDYRREIDDVSGVARGVRIALERWVDRNDWAKEISYAALLLECSCHRREERRLRELRDLHGHIWRMRFEPEGRVESLAKLPRF